MPPTNPPPASDATPTPAPQRRWTIEIDAGGDTLDDALSMVRHFLNVAKDGSRSCVSGGYSRCGFLKVEEYPDRTHDTFDKALVEWMAAQPEPRSNP